MTRLTSETALREIFHQYMMPPRFVTIMVMVMRTARELNTSRPINKKVTTKMANMDIPRDLSVSGHMYSPRKKHVTSEREVSSMEGPTLPRARPTTTGTGSGGPPLSMLGMASR
ncbi:hypothetical protein B566_EDAN005616 [Ephemera danica]|nr:hypothetical protein B566_EDAN005616 [Ephemera danica]